MVAGSTLTVPEVKTSLNDASTFKPYDPSEITGPTTPSLPYIPPPDKGCDPVQMIITTVIAVVVSVYAPVLAGKMATWMGGTVAAAGATAVVGTGTTMAAHGIVAVAASAVTRGIASAVGLASFSWKDVAHDGITSALAAGLSGTLRGAGKAADTGLTYTYDAVKNVRVLNPLGRVLQGVGNYAGGVVANTVVGRNTHFSWSAVAATAVGSYVSAKLGGKVPGLQGGDVTAVGLEGLGQNFVDGAVNASARRLFGLGRQNWGQIGFQALSSTLANEAAGGLMRWQAEKANRERLTQLLEQASAEGLRSNSAVTWRGFGTFGGGLGSMSPNEGPFNPLDEILLSGEKGGSTDWVEPSVEEYAAYNSEQKEAYWQALTQEQLNAWKGSGVDPFASATAVARLVGIRQQLDTKMESIGSMDPASAERLIEQRNLLTAALISKDVYFDHSIAQLLPKGVERISDDVSLRKEMGISNSMLVDEISGYYAAAYRVDGRYVIANRGTEMHEINDWIANLMQGTGAVGDQYELALRLAVQANRKVGDRLSFVGHSLGGGLASAQALAVRREAITFNAAGLHPATVEKFGIKPADGQDLIQAYYVQGEALSLIQDKVKPNVLGLAYASDGLLHMGANSGPLWRAASEVNGKSVSQLLAEMPAAAGRRIELLAHEAPTRSIDGTSWVTGRAIEGRWEMNLSSINLHGMSEVVYALYGNFGWTEPLPAFQPRTLPAMPGQFWPSPREVLPGVYR